MKKLLLSVCAFSLTLATLQAGEITKYVNPFIGTGTIDGGLSGNNYPGATSPFGMIQLSPDTSEAPNWGDASGYDYNRSTIFGFSHTRLSGTGASDLIDVTLMPTSSGRTSSTFTHDEEKASPGYYQVMLKDENINVELTTTQRNGIHRYQYPAGKDAEVILDMDHSADKGSWGRRIINAQIRILNDHAVEGYRIITGWAKLRKIYFYMEFSSPILTSTLRDGGRVHENTAVVNGTNLHGCFRFGKLNGKPLTCKVALSSVSMENARQNMEQEAPHWDFDRYMAAADADWEKQLGKIEIKGDNENDKVNFYTALYHSMIAPTIYSDVDGAYYGPDKKVHQADGWVNYSTFSLWDTYRAAHPLFTYTEPERVNDMVKSFIAFYEQNGRLPVWNFYGSETDMMIGYHAVPVIVDAYLKGIGDFDAKKALDACIATANLDNYRGIGLYKELGYIPYNVTDHYNAENWSLSKTLEYAFDDYCIAEMAEKMGKQDIADEFYKRSQNYKNVYNPATSFMQPRDDKGTFIKDFKADDYTPHICESNGWQYFWSVQHDINGLIDLVGGKNRFAEKLDSMFTYHPAADDELPIFSTGMIGQYAHGNEPSHHVIYLFNAIGHENRTQEYVAKVMNELYKNEPAGLCGNEDCGQMSAWYVFSAMGFYPVNPVSGKYEIGTPLFPEMQLHLANGKTFTVLAPKVNKENIYIQSIKIDGKPYDKTYLTHEQIMSGATVEFEMSNTPKAIGVIFEENNP